ncbi:MAG: hypothetical protein HZA52_15165 [Planctomycetes bacterium]|nr:hypothetical protein [Planctomycetota bacterium]
MVDTGNTAVRLVTAWLSTGRAIAVAAGALVALIALDHDVDLDIAALRGGLTTIVVVLLVKYGARALHWSETAPEPQPVDEKKERT